MEKLYALLSPEDQQRFWKSLNEAMKWKGWDAEGRHRSFGHCHACDFVKAVGDLAHQYHISFMEYT
jgi:hypothetical protein